MAHIFRICLILAIFLNPGVAQAQQGAPADPFAELDKLATAYRIQLVTISSSLRLRTWHGVIDSKNADLVELGEYIMLFIPEFTLYPPELVGASRLRRVVFCRELSYAGLRVAGIPAPQMQTLYLDVGGAADNKTYLRKCIHHEYFHIMDYWDDGSMEDERWQALNPPNFKYGGGGRTAQHLPDTGVLTDKYPGFLNHYSTTGVEEDKAELFAHLMVDPKYVHARAKTDPVLRAKIERLKGLLVEFCPQMNNSFWEQVERKANAAK